jgi:SAM-dependent methyltransferase
MRVFLAALASRIKEILSDPKAIPPHFAGLLRRLRVKKIRQDGEVFYQYQGRTFPEYLRHGAASSYVRSRALRHCHGSGIDVGAGSWPLPGAIPVQNDRDQNAFHLPRFADNSLDFVFSSHCLEHLRDWQAALKLWISKLKPGGILFLYLPHKDMLLWHPGGPWVGGHHRWIPEPQIISGFLKEVGVAIIECDPNPDSYFSFYIIGKKN